MSTNFTGKDFNYVNAFYKPKDGNDGGEGPDMGPKAGKIMNNVKGTIDYGSVLLMEDNSRSTKRIQKDPGVLGNAYFLNTHTECEMDGNSNQVPSRHIYINNRPSGEIPFISDYNEPEKMIDVKTPRGLIPGMISNIQRTNPSGLLNAIIPGSDLNKCSSVTLKVFNQDKSGKVKQGTETKYMSKGDICNLNDDAFSNPNDNIKERIECFTTFDEEEEVEENNYSNMPDDQVIQLYLSSITLLGLYLVLKFINKR